jgi:hypothetical protein
MNTTNITKEHLNRFVAVGKHYASTAEDSELKAAVMDVLEPAIKRLKKSERQRELMRLKLCKKTSTKHIERDKFGNLIFTEADNIKLLEEFDAIDAETVELPCEIVEDFPEEGLTYDTRMAFEGIVIPKVQRKFDNEEEEQPAEE